jgi:hypothetical protein
MRVLSTVDQPLASFLAWMNSTNAFEDTILVLPTFSQPLIPSSSPPTTVFTLVPIGARHLELPITTIRYSKSLSLLPSNLKVWPPYEKMKDVS